MTGRRIVYAILLLCLPWFGELEDDLPSADLSLALLPGRISPSALPILRPVSAELPPTDILLLSQRRNE